MDGGGAAETPPEPAARSRQRQRPAAASRARAAGSAGRPSRRTPAAAPPAAGRPRSSAPAADGRTGSRPRRSPAESRPSGGSILARVAGSGPEGRVVERDLEGAPRERRPPTRPATAPARLARRHRATARAFTDVPLTQIRKTIAKRLVAVDRARSPRSTSPPRSTWSGSPRRGRRSLRRRRGQGLVQRHRDQGGRHGAAAASRLQRLVAGRPHPLLERSARRHGGGGRGRPDHAGDPPRRPEVACGRSPPKRGTWPAGRGSASSSRRNTPAAPSRSPTSGMFDIDEFTAIINPPEAGILAVGRIVAEAGGARGPGGDPAADAAHHVLRSPGDRRRHRRPVPEDAEGDAGEPAGAGLVMREE